MQRRLYWLLCLSCWASAGLWAQQHHYSWKIGVHGGLSQYYGDLSGRVFDLPLHLEESPTQNFEYISYGLSVEHHWTRALGIRLLGTKNQFRASDRRYADGANFERALNVQTDVWDLSLIGVWYTDTDGLFGQRAFLSPYLLFGVGGSYFTPRGDLLDGDGDRYFYWTDNTIRTLDQTDPNAGNATVVERDYGYETDLAALQTEGRAYDPFTWNAMLGLGLKVRLSRKVTLHLEGLVRYTGTDYLDDVAGDYGSPNNSFQAYAANPSGTSRGQRGSSPEVNDWYAQGLLSVHYSFGQKTHPIMPSMIYTLGNETPLPPTPSPMEEPPLPPATLTPPTAQRSSTTQSDTVRTVITTTTTTITTTTIDSSRSGTRSTNIKPPTEPEGPSINQRMPIEQPDSAINSNIVVIETDEAVLDSLFEAEYMAANPPPVWVTPITLPNDSVSILIDTTITLPQRRLEDVIGSTMGPIAADSTATDSTTALPPRRIEDVIVSTGTPANNMATDSTTTVGESPNTNTISRATYDSLLQAYQADMEREREAYKNALREAQIRAEYERRLQEKDQEIAQLRNNTAAVRAASRLTQDAEEVRALETEATPELMNRAKSELTTEGRHQSGINAQKRQAIEQRLDTLQAEIIRLRQAPTPDSSAQVAQNAELDHLNQQLTAQQAELEQLRQAQQQDTTKFLLQTVETQQQELAQLRQALANQPATTKSDPAQSQLLQQLQDQQKELESLRVALLRRPAPSTDVNQRSAELEALRQTLAAQDQELAQLRQAAQASSTVPEGYDPDELDRLRAEELRLKARLAELEQRPAPAPDTVRVLQRSSDPAQAATIDRLRRELASISAERRQLAGTLQEFLDRKKPTHITKIYFEVGRSSLTPQAKETLTTLSEYLQSYPEVRFLVKGFASKTGSPTVNQRLSVERAAEVATYLNQLGIARERLTHAGMGVLETAVVDELDRRAEVHLSF